MEAFSRLLTAIGTVLWPLLCAAVVFGLRGPLRALLESGLSRKVTLKIGGQELTFDEASEQQAKLISDLQAQVVGVKTRLDAVSAPPSSFSPAVTALPAAEEPLRRVLWVDDEPKNNSFFVQQLSERSITVDLAMTTAEALRRLEKQDYDLLISDMGREEDGEYRPNAGVRFLQAVRAKNLAIPVVVYCGPRGFRDYAGAARENGATEVTTSPTDLLGILSRYLRPWGA